MIKCKKCKGTGQIKYYHDGGDHFGGGTAPDSGWETKPCDCGQVKLGPTIKEQTERIMNDWPSWKKELVGMIAPEKEKNPLPESIEVVDDHFFELGEGLQKKNDFSKAEVGQKLWNQQVGRYQIFLDCHNEAIKLSDDYCEYFFGSDGTNIYGQQIIFWRKPEIEFIPDPKKKVKKEVVRYVNVYKRLSKEISVVVYNDIESAKDAVNEYDLYNKYLLVGHKITIPYEEEE